MAGKAQGGNLYIVDIELLDTGGKLASHRNFLSEVIEDYLHIMDYITSSQKGEAIQAIKDITDQLRNVPSSIVEAGMNYKLDCEQYVSDIDAADRFAF